VHTIGFGIVINKMSRAAGIGQPHVNFSVAAGQEGGPVAVHQVQAGKDAVVQRDGLSWRHRRRSRRAEAAITGLVQFKRCTAVI
jgi:hypothetical protein